MKILQMSYKKRGTIEFVFEDFPHSKVTMAPIKGYYFVRAIKWSRRDRAVTRHDLEKFEWPQTKRSARRLFTGKEKHSASHRHNDRRWDCFNA